VAAASLPLIYFRKPTVGGASTVDPSSRTSDWSSTFPTTLATWSLYNDPNLGRSRISLLPFPDASRRRSSDSYFVQIVCAGRKYQVNVLSKISSDSCVHDRIPSPNLGPIYRRSGWTRSRKKCRSSIPSYSPIKKLCETG
jgi:hypothetical protein